MNEYQNRFDTDGSSKYMGNKAVSRFIKISKSMSFEFEFSSTQEDIKDHIDCWIQKEDTKYSVDIKAIKKTGRNDEEENSEWVWIEYKNVNGDDGWLYGKQQIIAFETPNGFLLVSRKDMQDLCEKLVPMSLVNLMNKAPHPEKAKRKLYTRKGRKDLLTMIHINDIKENIKYKTWIDKS